MLLVAQFPFAELLDFHVLPHHRRELVLVGFSTHYELVLQQLRC